jgi:hypothetical protein
MCKVIDGLLLDILEVVQVLCCATPVSVGR